MPDPILIVSGLPRTGTSMMMKMLEAGGIEPVTDRLREADIDNPQGYYEYEPVKAIAKDNSWIPATAGKVFKMVAPLLVHLPAEFEYRVVFMHRDPAEMLASQDKMLARLGQPTTGLSHEKMTALFNGQLTKVKTWLAGQPNIQCLELHYAEVLSDPARQAERINDFLDQPLDVAAMAATVDPTLYRNRTSPAE